MDSKNQAPSIQISVRGNEELNLSIVKNSERVSEKTRAEVGNLSFVSESLIPNVFTTTKAK